MRDQVQIEAMLRDFRADQALEINCQPVGGGDIHRSYRVTLQNRQQGLFETVFIKVCDIVHVDVMEAEYASLKHLVDGYSLSYPKPIFFGAFDDVCCMVMEYHHLENLSGPTIASQAGTSLAHLLAKQHHLTSNAFGWHAPNFIGLTPQINEWRSDWPRFYIKYRIQPQLELAIKNGLSVKLARKIGDLKSRIAPLFDGYAPLPTLLHGDLWSGNVAYDPGMGSAIVFDPAPYFGDREVDIAMTELFGTFPSSFYQTYDELLPLDTGYQDRKPLYNLYHALNHFNLFGAGYETLVTQLLTQTESNISKNL